MEQNTETRNEVNPHAYDQVILDKNVKNTKWSVSPPPLSDLFQKPVIKRRNLKAWRRKRQSAFRDIKIRMNAGPN